MRQVAISTEQSITVKEGYIMLINGHTYKGTFDNFVGDHQVALAQVYENGPSEPTGDPIESFIIVGKGLPQPGPEVL